MTNDADIVVVGAGVGGIAVTRVLLQAGFDVLVLERGSDVGGTWRDNVYPGVACDIPSHLYTFSWRPNPGWTRRFAPGGEIQEYLRRTAADEGIIARTRFSEDLLSARWQEAEGGWALRTSSGPLRCRVLVVATGRLSAPRLPEAYGLDTFPGRILHSSGWDPGLELSGARVAVVGTGASAAQIVPKVAAEAASTTLFQRTPAWVVPRGDKEIALEVRAAFAKDPEALRRHRDLIFQQLETGHAARAHSGTERAALRHQALEHLAAQVSHPVLREALTPRDEIGCRRVVLSDDYYPTLDSGLARLEASALVGFDGSYGFAASGARIPVDIVIMATGFHAARPPIASLVEGRNGLSLAEHWTRGMTAWATTMVPGFPNFFIVNGPNAALGHNSAVHMIESQAEFIGTLLVSETADNRANLEVDSTSELMWTAEMDSASAGTVWMSGCRSWYVDERSDRLTLLWPGSAAEFRRRLREMAAGGIPQALLGVTDH